MATLGTTAYAKFATEIYPSVIFPSFGSVLEPGFVPSSVDTVVVLQFQNESLAISPREWFDGPPSSALDDFADRLAELPQRNSDWMFRRADQLAETCVERIEITIPSLETPIVNEFERRCA